MPGEPKDSSRSKPGAHLFSMDAVGSGEAIGSGIVGVPTALPAFVGYTEFAGDPDSGESFYMKPVAIASLADFTARFGGPAQLHYAVAPLVPPAVPDFTAYFTTAAPDHDVELAGFEVRPANAGEEPAVFNLYWQMALFFANGGGPCLVVSVGSYWADRFPTAAPETVPADWAPGAIRAGTAEPMADLLGGLTVAGQTVGPTMIVIPEACQLDLPDYAKVACAMLEQAGTLGDRLAILDLPSCMAATTIDLLLAAQQNLWTAIAPAATHASYGAAYAPALQAEIVADEDVPYTVLVAGADGDNSLVNDILTTQAIQLYEGDRLAAVQAAIAAAFPLDGAFGARNSAQYSMDVTNYPPFDPAKTTFREWQLALNQALQDALPVLGQILRVIAAAMNVAPPSGALAGIWTASDAQSGVWSAPANIAVAQIAGPLYAMSDVEQGPFNTPTNGMAINILRSQLNRGTVVWGARTLDGNSADYRYIQVRRTLNYIQQSIGTALRSYATAPNDATTWSAVTAAISGFLTQLWQQGGLVGAKANDAFMVRCGIGSTMTPLDALDGRMIVTLALALLHPAEYFELEFVQVMAG
jgi:phage tail sheath protein FI